MGTSAVGLSDGRALVCITVNDCSHSTYCQSLYYVICRVMRSEDGLAYPSKGEGMMIASVASKYDVAHMIAITADTALICFRDGGANSISRCRLLRAAGMDLSWDGDGVTLPLALPSGGSNRLVVLSSHTAVVCAIGGCALLEIHGSSVTVGPAAQTGVSDDEDHHRWVAKIWTDRNLWCGYFNGGRLSCSLQRLRNQSIEFGAFVDQPFRVWDMGMVPLGEGRVLACYTHVDPNEPPVQCRFFTVPTIGGH